MENRREEPQDSGPGGLSHLDRSGAARMVDIGGKTATRRVARAAGRVRMLPATQALLRSGPAPKGDVLAAARLAGIQGAKETSRLIPLCHPLPLERVSLDFAWEGEDALSITAEAAVTARTGVEMEALTAVAIAALTVYDMLKAVDPAMRIEEIRLLSKEKG